jgi:hypothetical protein
MLPEATLSPSKILPLFILEDALMSSKVAPLLQVLAQSNQRVSEISSLKANPQISSAITSMSLELVQSMHERIDVAGKVSEGATEVAQSPQRLPKTLSSMVKAQTSPAIALPLPVLAQSTLEGIDTGSKRVGLAGMTF